MNLLHDNSIMPRFGWMLVHSLWQGIIVAAVLAVILRGMSRATAQLRYVLCCCALAAVVSGAIATYCIIGGQVQAISAPNQSVIIPQPHSSAGSKLSLPMADSSAIPANADYRGILQIVVIAWGFGVVVISLWHLLGWISLWRIRRGRPLPALQIRLERLRLQLGIRQAVRLIETARLNAPAVIGVFRPIILLPIGILSDLTPEQVDAILMHELAHIARYDYAVNLMQAVVEALMFYHPVVWWISSQIRREREHCCDDIAAASCGDTRTYATTLLALEQRRMPAGLLALAATDGNLLNRIRRVLKLPPSRVHHPARSMAAVLLALVCLGLPFAAVAQQKPSPVSATGPVGEVVYSPILSDDLKPGDTKAASQNTELQKPVFTILGQVEKPGQYELSKPDFHLSTALDWAGGLSKDGIKLIVIRSVPKGQTGRVLNIPIAKLRAGDPGVDVIIRPNDVIVASSPAATRPNDSVLKHDNQYYIGGFVQREGVYALSNNQINLEQAIIAAGELSDHLSDAYVTVIRRSDNAETFAIKNVRYQDLLAGKQSDVYVRENDIVYVTKKPMTVGEGTTIQGHFSPPEDGEYYVGGDGVQRVGVYSVPPRRITVKQAVIAAGTSADDAYISVIRRDHGKSTFPLQNASFADLMSGKQPDVYLTAHDIVRVTKDPLPKLGDAATKPSAVK